MALAFHGCLTPTTAPPTHTHTFGCIWVRGFSETLQHSVWFTLPGASVLDTELENLQTSYALAPQGEALFKSCLGQVLLRTSGQARMGTQGPESSSHASSLPSSQRLSGFGSSLSAKGARHGTPSPTGLSPPPQPLQGSLHSPTTRSFARARGHAVCFPGVSVSTSPTPPTW